MKKPKATVVVAQAPMCLMKAWPLIMRLRSNFDWNIVYLTRKKDDGHNTEMQKVWEHTGVQLHFLQFEHYEADEENFEIGFDRDDATSGIKTVCEGSELLVTHNHIGEWGHVYHVFVNSVLADIDRPRIYFGYNDDNDNNLIILPKAYGNMEIPMDRLQWTKQWFDGDGSLPTGKYCCDKEALKLLKDNSNGLSFDLNRG
jgi:hypothetical protein